MTKKTLEISEEIYDELQRLKHIMGELLDRDNIQDDEIIGSLIGGFIQSMNEDMIEHTHMPKNGGCCGGSCHTDKKDTHEHHHCGGHCKH